METTRTCKEIYPYSNYSSLNFGKGGSVPILLSSPSSGTIFLRELVELSTGMLTGTLGEFHMPDYSPFDDYVANKAFSANNECALSLAMISNDEPARAGISAKAAFHFPHKIDRVSCYRGKIFGFQHILLLVRNPYEAILKKFEKVYSVSPGAKNTANYNYTEAMLKPIDFESSRGYDVWRKFAEREAEIYGSMWENLILPFCSLLLQDMFLVKYEDLLEPYSMRVTVNALTSFVMRRPVVIEDSESAPSRVRCAPLTASLLSHDALDLSRYRGSPYKDPKLVKHMASFIESYASAFQYSLEPPAHLTGAAPVAAVVDQSSSTSLTTQSDTSTSTGAGTGTGTGDAQVTSKCPEPTQRAKTSLTNKLRASSPPILFAPPGSGGLIVRELMEIITGLTSGSLTSSKPLVKDAAFISDGECSPSNSVVYSTNPISITILETGSLALRYKADKQACSIQKTDLEVSKALFDRVIIVSRNPYETLASAYEMKVTSEKGATSKISFSGDDWERFALQQAAELSKEWLHHIHKIGTHIKLHNVILITFEELSSDTYLEKKLPGLYSLSMSPQERDFPSVDCIRKQVRFPDLYRLNTSRYEQAPFQSSQFLDKLKPILSPYCNSFNYEMDPPPYLVSISPSTANTTTTEDSSSSPKAVVSTNSSTSIDPITTFTNSNKLFKKIQCASTYGRRHFCSAHSNRVPPLLLSYPGSGNTWVRLLVEFATGYYTGCIYSFRDMALEKDFVGERYCHLSTSAIKAHPQDVMMKRNNRLEISEKGSRIKCRTGGISSFNRIIFVVRNPYHSILSEYHRLGSSGHNSAVELDKFNSTNWKRLALQLAREYESIWNNTLLPMMTSSSIKNVVVKYEDLLDHNKRTDNLRSMVQFINRDPDNLCLGINHTLYPSEKPVTVVDESKVNCAFRLGDSQRTHRSTTVTKVNATTVYKEDPEFVDTMWEHLKGFATFFGYDKL